MCRSARQPGGECRTPCLSRWPLVLVAVLAFVAPAPTLAQGPAGAADPTTGAEHQVMGEVIDVTGLRERPRGDTTLPWSPPEGFGTQVDVDFGRALRDEVLAPVDRNELKRLLEVERSLRR